ncbi:TonB-dependent receptor [Pseudooceanicola sp. CBS1P-1]|uniref:TonB-dependent receptor n=1 Tax=Pseudooceanicola albus TaxID=2692189 RepID=A0A6L7G124_9RHOB|nr:MULTISPECIES: TonB-dependent receptor [Pseudooceanicola]MBT9383547.1 TonB-dependent receptor [Pseudooceanicola endophyticus]MXN17402.1 TonB-dependent receptor [Pseudooceanicola albus]
MTHVRHRLAVTTALGLLLSAGVIPLAQAQETTSLDAITVADDTDTGPAGTSGTATITQEAMQKKQATSVAEAVEDVPGVTTTRSSDLLHSSISIRGYGGNSAMPDSQNVVTALDGVSTAGGNYYRDNAGQVVDPLLLKQVSVLKGPLASLEYGSGILGGTVAMETINAADLTGDTPGFKFRQVLGANSNGNGWKTSSTLAWQANENFDFLANYSRSYSENREDGHGDEIDLGGYNVPSLLLKARYRFGENRDQALTFSYDRSESVQQNVPYATASMLSIFGNVNRDRTGNVAKLSYTYKPASNPLVDLEVSYARSRQQYHIEGLSMISSMFAGDYDVDTDTLAATNTARFSTGSVDHTLRAGVSFAHQDHDGVMSGVAGDGEYDRTALFAMDQMDFGQDWSLSAGARIEHQQLTNLHSSTGADLDDMDSTARTAGLGLEKGLGHGFTGYASFTYGEGLTLPEYAGNTWSNGKYWGEDTSHSRTWETGLRYHGDSVITSGDGLEASIGVYKIDVWDANSYPSTAYELQSSSGLEAQLGYRLASGFYTRASMVTSFSNKYRQRTSSGDSDYPYALTDQGRLTLGKTFANGLDVSWTLRGGVAQDLNDLHQAGWGVNDIAVSYTVPEGRPMGGMRVDFGIDNVFDKYYVTQYTTSSASYPESGRDFRLTLSRTF